MLFRSDALRQGQAAAALLASLLHDGVLTVEAIKQDLLERGLPLRPLQPLTTTADVSLH